MKLSWLTKRSVSRTTAASPTTTGPASPVANGSNADILDNAAKLRPLELKRRLKELDTVLQTMHLSQHTLSLVISGASVQRDIATAASVSSGGRKADRARVTFSAAAGGAGGSSGDDVIVQQQQQQQQQCVDGGSRSSGGSSITLKNSTSSTSPTSSASSSRNVSATVSLVPAVAGPPRPHHHHQSPPPGTTTLLLTPRSVEPNVATLQVVRGTMQRAISTMANLLRTLVEQVDRLEPEDGAGLPPPPPTTTTTTTQSWHQRAQSSPPTASSSRGSRGPSAPPALPLEPHVLSHMHALQAAPYPRRMQVSRLIHAWDEQWARAWPANESPEDDIALSRRIDELMEDLRKIRISIERENRKSPSKVQRTLS